MSDDVRAPADYVRAILDHDEPIYAAAGYAPDAVAARRRATVQACALVNVAGPLSSRWASLAYAAADMARYPGWPEGLAAAQVRDFPQGALIRAVDAENIADSIDAIVCALGLDLADGGAMVELWRRHAREIRRLLDA